MSDKKADPATSLLRSSVDSFTIEYEELSQNWRHIDNKAQSNITISGIFIAAIFAFIKDLSSSFELWQKIVLVADMLALIASVSFSLVALLVRKVQAAPLGEVYSQIVTDLLNVDDFDSDENQRCFINDMIKIWHKTNRETYDVYSKKARYLAYSQYILIVAIILVVILSISRIFV